MTSTIQNSKTFFSLLMYVIKENGDFLCKVWEKTENLDSKIFKTKSGRLIIQSKCSECGITKLRFVKSKNQKDYLVV